MRCLDRQSASALTRLCVCRLLPSPLAGHCNRVVERLMRLRGTKWRGEPAKDWRLHCSFQWVDADEREADWAAMAADAV